MIVIGDVGVIEVAVNGALLCRFIMASITDISGSVSGGSSPLITSLICLS